MDEEKLSPPRKSQVSDQVSKLEKEIAETNQLVGVLVRRLKIVLVGADDVSVKTEDDNSKDIKESELVSFAFIIKGLGEGVSRNNKGLQGIIDRLEL